MKKFQVEPLVWIVIPTRNRLNDLNECLQSIENQTYQNYKIVIVDNNSEDNTLETIRSNYSSIETIHLEKNFGAAYATNRGFEFALNHAAKFVLRLDSDTILDENYLKFLIMGMGVLSDCGITSGTIYNFFRPEQIWFTGGILTKWDLNAHFLESNYKNMIVDNSIYEVDLLPSTGMLISREVIEKTKGFDEDYLVYYEDFDFCLKAKRIGKKIYFISDAKMWHKVFSNKKTTWTALNWNKSKMIYYRKHARNMFHLGFLVIYAFAYAFFRAWFPKEDRGNRGPLIPTINGLLQGLTTKLNPPKIN